MQGEATKIHVDHKADRLRAAAQWPADKTGQKAIFNRCFKATALFNYTRSWSRKGRAVHMQPRFISRFFGEFC